MRPVSLHRLADRARVLHGVGQRLLDVGVTAGPHRLHRVQRVLEVGRRDDHRVDVLAVVELVVVAAQLGPPARELLDVRRALLAPPAPDVRQRDDLEVVRLRLAQKRRQQRTPEPVGVADHPDAHAIVGALDGCVRRGGPQGQPGRAGTRHLDELAT
jgi:hypothetical protein